MIRYLILEEHVKLAPKSTLEVKLEDAWPAAVGGTVNIRIVPQVGTPVTYTCTNDGKTFC